MSLTKTSLAEIVKKQYFHKLRANIDAFSALVGIQVLAVLFSLLGVSSSGTSGNGLWINVKYYSADGVIIFTLFWAFVTAITVNTKQNRYHDFTFVTSRVSSGISNILFLATAGLLGSITALLAGNLIKAVLFLSTNQSVYSTRSGPEDALTGIAVMFFYLLLVSSIGYFISSLTAFSKVFILLIPVLIVGMIMLGEAMNNQFFLNTLEYYVEERNILLFSVKALITACAFYTAGIAVLQRMEVRN
ncbi:hypothetical protein [Bacillus sp. B-jedd]|uniref:hypothetical protein n=1 Tax=Bacillus sp. B-jedd TaxID=1476857 RepID=UPI0005156028|nr:hypothetical protein [Bacillus sp. B-jedd]CEG26518.1 hypothetical protein BN1002_01365 [Bacillus sp. B-jedd]